MLKLLLLTICFFITSCFIEKKQTNILEKFILEISFQDFFKQDKVRLSVGSCLILNDTLITSDESDGFTGVAVKLYSKDQSTIIKNDYLKKQNECKIDSSYLDITVFVNDVEIKYTIDPQRGRYIGLNKKGGDNLSLIQSMTPFIYD